MSKSSISVKKIKVGRTTLEPSAQNDEISEGLFVFLSFAVFIFIMTSFTVEDQPDRNNNDANTGCGDENVFHIDVSPSSWLKIEEFECASKSVQFSLNDLNGQLKEDAFKTLFMFEGAIVNSSPVMFCGGPVTAMAWSRNNPDVLAIASKLKFTPSPIDNMDPAPGLVQLWSAGAEGARPELLFSMHHNHGVIWDLEWAPGSGPGLGPIAAACGDGSVRVWAMPLSEQLGNSGAVFTKSADLNLVVGDPINGAGQCLGLSWYQGPGHGYLAACFTSGMVSLWHLTTTSPLLRSEDTIVASPTWPAHYGRTTGVSLSIGTQPIPTHVVTGGGQDHCYKFWDLRGIYPVELRVVKQGMILDVKWISGRSGACVIFDDLSKSGLLVVEAGSHSTPVCPMVSEVSSVTGLALSSWLSCAALCTSAGELIVCELPLPLKDRMEQEPRLSMGHVYRTKVAPVPGCTPPDTKDRRQYEAIAASSRLLYHDTALQNPDPEDSLQMEPEDVTSFPLAGLTSVAWNNSPSRRSLLASGGHAGIVRVHNLKKLGSHAMP